MSYYPPSILPSTAEADIIRIVRREGISALRLKDVRIHLEGIYKADFRDQKLSLYDILRKVLNSPEFKRTAPPAEHNNSNTATTVIGAQRTASQRVPPRRSAVPTAPVVSPKPPRTVRDYFMDANRESIPTTNEDGTHRTARDIERVLREQFNNMALDEEVVYAGLANQDRVRYELERDAYIAHGGDTAPMRPSQGGGLKPAKKQRDPNKPKKPLTSYLAFAKECRREVAQHASTHQEISKCLGEMWGSLSTNDKAQYEAVAAEDRERYFAECRERGYTPIPYKNTPAPATAPTRRYTLNRVSSSDSDDDGFLFCDEPPSFTPTTTTTATAAAASASPSAPTRRYTLNRVSNSDSDDIFCSDEHPTHNAADRDPSVGSVFSDASEGVFSYPSSESCRGEVRGPFPSHSHPNHTYNQNTPLSDIFMIGLHNEFNAELTAMEDAIEELQRGCDRLEASSNAERQAYFKVKVLLGEKRMRRDAAPSLL